MTDSSANTGHGNRPLHEDDPLMELSRIFSFDRPAEGSSDLNVRPDNDPYSGAGRSDPALDLERELFGNFDAYSEPVRPAEVVDHGFHQYSDVEPLSHDQSQYEEDADFDLSLEALELRLDDEVGQAASAHAAPAHSAAPEAMEFVDVEQGEDVANFDFDDFVETRHQFTETTAPQYSNFGAGAADFAGDFAEQDNVAPAHYDAALETPESAYRLDSDLNALEQEWPQETPAPAFNMDFSPKEPKESAPSLEDELENLLFAGGDAVYPSKLKQERADDFQNYHPVAEPEVAFDDVDFHLDADEIADEPAYGHDFVQQAATEEAAYSRLVEPSGFPHYKLSNFTSAGREGYSSAHIDQNIDQTHGAHGTQGSVEEPSFAADQHDDLSLDDFSFEPAAEQSASGTEATDDDLFGLDSLELTEDDFDFEPAGDHDFPQQDELSLTAADFDEEDFFGADVDRIAEEDELPLSAPAYAHATHGADDYVMPAFTAHTGARRAVDTPPPEVETLSVSESKVEQTHSFDLPEVDYGEAEPSARLAELEAEFADVFNSIEVDDTTTRTETQSEADKAFEDIFRESASTYLPTGGLAASTALGLDAAADAYNRAKSASQTFDGQTSASSDDFYNHWAVQGAQTMEGDDFGARASMPAEDDLGQAAQAYRERPVRGRRGLILASVAGVAVLLAGVGYHFMAGTASDEPVVIRADDQPIKMQPENPGGTVVPNQDKAVYDRVSGTMPDNPEQKSLITSGEDPVDISGTDDSESSDETPASNVTAHAAPQPEEPLIRPREVETMVVRSDGTIMQHTTPAPAQPEPAQGADSAAHNPAGETAVRDEIAQIAAGGDPVPEALKQAETTAAKPVEQPKPPVRAPIVPSRPAEQPVNIVGNVPQRTQTQAAGDQATQLASAAGGAGGYFIQVASQPSAELAQKSYANIAQKYASVIGGRGVDIKRAEIPGKGTYYRVRVSAGSREDANALCQRLKAAGGSCLVTR